MVLVVVGVVGRWVEDSRLGRSLDSPLSYLLRAERRYNKALGDTDGDGGGEGASRSVSANSLPPTPLLLLLHTGVQTADTSLSGSRALPAVMPRLSGLERVRGGDGGVCQL